MKKIVLTYGLISGLIVCAWMLTALAVGIDHMDTTFGMILAFSAMAVGFSLIFVAVKKYRDQQLNGAISFGKAFKIGLYISLFASSMYVVTWIFAYYFFVPDFMEQYAAHSIEALKASGAAQSEIDVTTVEMAEFREMYKNPLFNAMITYTEILPMGLAFSVLAALLFKRKPAAEIAL